MEFLYLIFYSCLSLRFLEVKTNPSHRRPVPTVCRLLCSNVRAWPGTLVTWPWRRLGMTYCCVLRLWSQICITCRSCWFPDLVALSCCAVAGCRGPEGWRHTYEMDMEHLANPSLSVVDAKCCFLGFVVRGQSLPQPWPRWPDFLLFANINGCCAGRGCACLFPVCGWFEWPSSGVVGFYNHKSSWGCNHFATVSGCDQLVVGPTHARGGTLDLLMTNVPDLVRVSVLAAIGNSITPLCRQSFRWLRLF